MIKNKIHETVLYYTPEQSERVRKLKGVLVRMGIRIKNVTEEQAGVTVGELLGLAAYSASGQSLVAEEKTLPVQMDQELLVMYKFTGRRLDELLLNLRKAGVSKVELKAIVTDTNIGWTLGQLYREIKDEHDKMSE